LKRRIAGTDMIRPSVLSATLAN